MVTERQRTQNRTVLGAHLGTRKMWRIPLNVRESKRLCQEVWIYTAVTNVVVNSKVTTTNQALGLLSRSIRAAGSTDAATADFFYDGRGFLTNSIKYTGTTDPNITNSFFYNNRGELVQQTDAQGRSTRFDYDGLGHLKAKEIYDTGGVQSL